MRIEELLESFTSSYQFALVTSSQNVERYVVMIDDLGLEEVGTVEYDVVIAKNPDFEDMPSVGFGLTMDSRSKLRRAGINPGGPNDITGIFNLTGSSPIKLLSTVIQVIKQSKMIRKVGVFFIEAEKGQGNRARLYSSILRKQGLVDFEEFDTGDTKGFKVTL